jgi:asparagine synthase (glutamine-hydrolysing)
MPGMVGLITKMPRHRAEPELRQMVAAMRHESFYETGMWVDESLGVYVGWTALRGSFSDGMPVRNEKKDVVLVFSGEEFPPAETRSTLKKRGHEIDAGEASYLTHLYEEDASFPVCLNGRFHGALIDRTRRTTTLFNDRYGMHRLYYHESKDAFYFAAECKAILAVCPELRSVAVRGLGEFVSCGCVLEHRTVFEGIYMLPPASRWTFADGSIQRKGAYFEAEEWEEQEALDPESYYREVRDIFARNLPRYFNGRQEIGMSLTGGFDTRAVMAWQKRPAGGLSCYTYGGMFRECQDVRVARQVAKVCNQPHQVIPVGGEFLCSFAHYAERSIYLSDGSIDLLRSPDLYVSERAREIAPVRMTGLYGDEVLRHMRAFKPMDPTPGIFSPEFMPCVRQARSTYTSLLSVHPLSFSVFRQAPWHHYGILALEQTQLTVRTPFLDNDFIRTVFRCPKSASMNNDLRLRLIAEGNPALQRIRTDRGFGGGVGVLRATAARHVLEFTYKAEYAYDYGMPQWLARMDHLFSPFQLERLFLGRHKQHHFRVWYRDVLSAYVREILLDRRSLSRPYIERRGVEDAVRGHIQGNRNYTLEIHKLLTLELLHRLFIDPA